MSGKARLATGVPGLDECLGGGLIPGTLAVVVGASGIGKTQLGMQFAKAGSSQEGLARHRVRYERPHRSAKPRRIRPADVRLATARSRLPREPARTREIFQPGYDPGDYLHVFERSGRRVTQRDMDFDAWHDWQAELAAKLEATIAFFYGNFIRGVRRAVIDGIEPAERPSESIQFELFEYIYHQILRKDHDWVARDLLRRDYRRPCGSVERASLRPRRVGCLLLYTSHETMLDDLIERPLVDGELLANANTLIQMGKIRGGERARARVVRRQASRQRSQRRDSYLSDHRRRRDARLKSADLKGRRHSSGTPPAKSTTARQPAARL